MDSFGDTAVFKTSIKNIVKAYQLQYPEEYALLTQAVEMQRALLHDKKFGRLEGSPDHRALYEISETLSQSLNLHLSEEAIVWFKTNKGGRWFAKTYPEFALPALI